MLIITNWTEYFTKICAFRLNKVINTAMLKLSEIPRYIKEPLQKKKELFEIFKHGVSYRELLRSELKEYGSIIKRSMEFLLGNQSDTAFSGRYKWSQN